MPAIPTMPQGQSFSVLIKLGNNPIADLPDWTVRCQIRRKNNSQPSGFIADLDVTLVDPETMTYRLHKADTDAWPIGLVELDLRFINPDENRTLITNRREFEIVRSVSKK